MAATESTSTTAELAAAPGLVAGGSNSANMLGDRRCTDESGASGDADGAGNSRSRWRVSARESSVLDVVFASSPRPNKSTLQQLATMLGVKPRQVQVWFQNRRQRWRKDFLELERARMVQQAELSGKVIDFHGDLPIPGATDTIVGAMPGGWDQLLLVPDEADEVDEGDADMIMLGMEWLLESMPTPPTP
ncbi:homeobox domain-containing protein [Pavlovales sp. CCMP2436]|nr:homeobox domain-containing protein [Pavlovales sp. CCMP2436]